MIGEGLDADGCRLAVAGDLLVRDGDIVQVFQVILIRFFEIMEVIRAFKVHAFVEDEVLPFFLRDVRIAAVRAVQFYGREAAFGGREPGGADLAEELPFGTAIFIKEGFWGITARAGAVTWDVTFRASADRPNPFAIAFLVVRDELFVSPFLPEV